MSVLIRKAETADIPSLLMLSAQCRNFHNRLLKDYFVNPDPSAEEKFLQAAVVEEDKIFLVAQKEKTIVGMLWAYFKTLPYLRAPFICQIDTLCVNESDRRTGVGRLLMEKLRQICRQTGADEIKLSAYVANTDAVSFYKSLGFAEKALDMRLKP